MVTSGSKKHKMAAAKMQTRGFKTAVDKPVGDVTTAMFINYTVYGTETLYNTRIKFDDEYYIL